MFKKLYKNLLVLNVSVLSLLLLIIFTSLYIATYTDITNRISNELTLLVDQQVNNTIPPDGPNNTRPDRSFSLIVVIESDGTTIETISQFNLSNLQINSMISSATNDEGNISVDEEIWSYQKLEVNDETIIAFVNSSNEMDLLNSTLTRFIIIFVVSIAVTTLLSSFITKRTIKPVKESFDKQKQFVSDASHELKTPLTVINTNVDVLLSEDKTNNKWLHYIKDEITRMNKLTNDLLYLANMSEFEKSNIIKSKFNMSDKVESIILGIEALAYEKNIKLNYTIAPKLEVEFNIEQFHQVIMVLLDNAIKYTNVNGSIDVTIKEQNNYAVMAIRNTGSGISKDNIEYVFDRFYKTDKSRENKSNSFGLGLSIAKTICENNDSKLTVSSLENEYTEFGIKLKSW